MAIKIEEMYPDKKAREAADEVVDGMSNDESMTAFIVAWEEAYLLAGGNVCF